MLRRFQSPLSPAALACFLTLISLPAAAQNVTEFPLPNIPGGEPFSMTAGPDSNLWFTDQKVSAIVRITTAGVATAFPTLTPNAQPAAISRGFDGALWSTEDSANAIGHLTVNGTVKEFALPTKNAEPGEIAPGPDGNMWFLEIGVSRLAKITPSGAITEIQLPSPASSNSRFTDGPDGAFWVTESSTNKIARVTTTGTVTEFTIPTASSGVIGITVGHDGNLWFTESGANQIGVMTTAGDFLTTYPIPTAGAGATTISRGTDGALWFGEKSANKIARIDATGAVTEFAVPTSASGVGNITAGSDGAMWFPEQNANQIGRVVPLTSSIVLASAVLPGSRAVEVGTAATVYATVINGSTSTAQGCAIAPIDASTDTFSYQTTDPTTNALSGTPNTPVDIPAGQAQTFVLALTPTAPFAAEVVDFGFFCANANPAAITPGVNTMLLLASSTPVPDVVALAATASNDGILHLPSTSGSNAFAVATVNVGASASVTATPSTGVTTLPLSLFICQTDPISGNCLASPAASVTTTIATDTTPTFAIFATASGAIPFQPASNRIFVAFTANGQPAGRTSVAVSTP